MINWNIFKDQLTRYPELKLQFLYTEKDKVSPGYHITEIKQAQISSVDCGGRMDTWTEIVIQLWEPKSGGTGTPMEVTKAVKIIDIVESKMALDAYAIVKIEYGNPSFGTRQMPVSRIIAEGENLHIHLEPDTTQCKATDVCGKPKVKLSELTPAGNCCNVESGCC